MLLNCGVGEDSLRVPWTVRRSNQSILKETSPGCSLEGLTETPILWSPHAESWLIWKDPNAGKDWGQKKETTEDEMVGWHHWRNGHGFGWTPGIGDGQLVGLVCCGSWGHKELDVTEWLNWTERLYSRNKIENVNNPQKVWSPTSEDF